MEYKKASETVGKAAIVFQEYKRSAVAEMVGYIEGMDLTDVSISKADKDNGSPKIGDMIARNPKNHKDKWLVAEQYFNDNFEVGVKVDNGINEGLTFGDAVEALKKGRMICRVGWNGSGMFVFMQVPSEVPCAIVPRMTSLPQRVKDEFDKREKVSSSTNTKEHLSIRYQNQLALVKPTNEINGWVPSSADTLAEDWIILE